MCVFEETKKHTHTHNHTYIFISLSHKKREKVGLLLLGEKCEESPVRVILCLFLLLWAWQKEMDLMIFVCGFDDFC